MTDTELKILNLFRGMKDTRDIGRELHLTEATIEVMLHNALAHDRVRRGLARAGE